MKRLTRISILTLVIVFWSLVFYHSVFAADAITQRCAIYGLGHKTMINTYTPNIKVYYHGAYIRTISQPGSYRLGMDLASKYTCK